MLKFFRTVHDITNETDEITNGTWIELTNPTAEEIQLISDKLNLDTDDLEAPSDLDEKNRIEFIRDYILIVVDIPIMEKHHDAQRYKTVPLGIILTDENIVTVCTEETPILTYFHQEHTHIVSTKKHIRFIYEILMRTVLGYQKALTEIDKKRIEFEENIENISEETDLIRLHELETTLVYFATALRGNQNVLNRLKRYTQFHKYPEDMDLLDDIIIENQQAIEMTEIYRDIIDGTRELTSNIMDNRLNQVMKRLTSLTIILSVPTIISGMYGMNVDLNGMPMAQSIYGFGSITLLIIFISVLLYIWLKRNKML